MAKSTKKASKTTSKVTSKSAVRKQHKKDAKKVEAKVREKVVRATAGPGGKRTRQWYLDRAHSMLMDTRRELDKVVPLEGQEEYAASMLKVLEGFEETKMACAEGLKGLIFRFFSTETPKIQVRFRTYSGYDGFGVGNPTWRGNKTQTSGLALKDFVPAKGVKVQKNRPEQYRYIPNNEATIEGVMKFMSAVGFTPKV